MTGDRVTTVGAEGRVGAVGFGVLITRPAVRACHGGIGFVKAGNPVRVFLAVVKLIIESPQAGEGMVGDEDVSIVLERTVVVIVEFDLGVGVNVGLEEDCQFIDSVVVSDRTDKVFIEGNLRRRRVRVGRGEGVEQRREVSRQRGGGGEG